MKAKPPSLIALQHDIASLPFDVLLRRIHSSSQRNPSRSLEAHFVGVDFASSMYAKSAEYFDLRTSNETHSKPKLSTTTEGISSLQLREILSLRLLQDVQQSRTRLHLNLDDLSLILTNAVRHKFSFELTTTTLRLFTETLSQVRGKDAASQQIEALSRVMEACCEELAGNDFITWDGLANLVAMVEQRWSLFTKSNSLCCLLIQFFSAVLAVEHAAESTAATNMLKTNPDLLKDRCLQLVHDATSILTNRLEAGDIPLNWSPADLQGMCTVVRQLRCFEAARKTSSTSSSGRVRFWKRSSATTPSEAVVGSVPVHKQVGHLVERQVLLQAHLVSDIQTMTLPQVASVFSSASFACGTEIILRFAVPVHNVLKRTVVADVGSMKHIIHIAEASLHVEGGASLVFVEAVRSMSRFSFVLTSGGTSWDLLCSACTLLENAPLSLRAVVVECLCVFQKSLENSHRQPSPLVPEFESFRLSVFMMSTLLVQHNLQMSSQMEEILHRVVEAAPLLRENSKRGASMLMRCFFFLTSSNRLPTNVERERRVLHLVMMEVKELLNEKAEGSPFQLTNMERTMLRQSLKRSREMTVCMEEKLSSTLPPQPVPLQDEAKSQVIQVSPPSYSPPIKTASQGPFEMAERRSQI